MRQDKIIGVFYYQYSPEIKCGGNLLDWENFNLKGCGTKIEISFNKFLNSNFAGIVNNYITFDSNNQGIISGLFLVNLEEKTGDDFKSLGETDSNIEKIFGEDFPIQDCNFIIPQKNFKAD
ncbi:hypothetical protein EOM09_05885 [bacterium]|nr:hypothetical protein [bacterium]